MTSSSPNAPPSSLSAPCGCSNSSWGGTVDFSNESEGFVEISRFLLVAISLKFALISLFIFDDALYEQRLALKEEDAVADVGDACFSAGCGFLFAHWYAFETPAFVFAASAFFCFPPNLGTVF